MGLDKAHVAAETTTEGGDGSENGDGEKQGDGEQAQTKKKTETTTVITCEEGDDACEAEREAQLAVLAEAEANAGEGGE